MDFKRFLQAVRRHKLLVILICLLGVGLGAGYTVLRPPMLTSNALVELPSPKFIQTQVIIADSPPVLALAAARLDEAVSVATLRKQVKVTTVTTNVLEVTAKGVTAAQAEHMANAVAQSYLSYVSSAEYPGP